ncbi:MAG TPA: SAM-dependent methyltransferase [Clostridiales bacterium]|nr:SAM-dependent methyltransferase [Clostridiales bacterium]
MVKLSKRLSLVAEFVPYGSKVADVGTDHGLLAIALSQSKHAKVVACDINKGPLETAAENINRYGAQNIELRLGNGLDCVRPKEVDVIVIAGMGGETIAQIIQRAEWVKSHEISLILQPMSSANKLRRFLYTNGFDIFKEKAVYDNKRLYSVMQVGYTGEIRSVSPLYFYIGAMGNNGGIWEREYIKTKTKQLKKRAKALETVERKRSEYLELLDIIEQLEEIQMKDD